MQRPRRAALCSVDSEHRERRGGRPADGRALLVRGGQEERGAPHPGGHRVARHHLHPRAPRPVLRHRVEGSRRARCRGRAHRRDAFALAAAAALGRGSRTTPLGAPLGAGGGRRRGGEVVSQLCVVPQPDGAAVLGALEREEGLRGRVRDGSWTRQGRALTEGGGSCRLCPLPAPSRRGAGLRQRGAGPPAEQRELEGRLVPTGDVSWTRPGRGQRGSGERSLAPLRFARAAAGLRLRRAVGRVAQPRGQSGEQRRPPSGEACSSTRE